RRDQPLPPPRPPLPLRSRPPALPLRAEYASHRRRSPATPRAVHRASSVASTSAGVGFFGSLTGGVTSSSSAGPCSPSQGISSRLPVLVSSSPPGPGTSRPGGGVMGGGSGIVAEAAEGRETTLAFGICVPPRGR